MKTLQEPEKKETITNERPSAKQLPPSPKEKHWFFGNVGSLVRDFLGFMKKTVAEVGPIAWLTSPLVKICIIFDPEMIKYVVQENNKNYTKGMVFRHLIPILGNGLLTSEGEFWRRQRRLAQPAFHKQRLAEMVNSMVECTKELIREWEEKYPEGSKINITKEMNRIALVIVSSALFKSDVKKEFSSINQNLTFLVEVITKRFRFPFLPPLWVPTRLNLKQKAAIKELDKVIQNIIDKKRKTGASEKEGDLLDMLMEAVDEETGEKMSDKQLRDEVMTIFLAGHETSANALAYLWLLLSENPQAERKVVEEIQNLLQGRAPEAEDLKNLVYLRQVIHETLRLFPPVYAFERCSIEEDVIGGYHIPKRTNVIVPAFIVHRLPAYWDEPDQFRPERFESEKMKKMPRYAFFPFGGGPRLCIGDQFAIFEMLVVVSMLRQKFRLHKPEDYQLKLDPLVTLRPREDIVLLLEKIS